MARRSQCSSAGDNPLDPNYLPPHYREEYRLAIDALIEEDVEGYYQFLLKADVVDFLSDSEIRYIQNSVQAPKQSSQPELHFLDRADDGSSDTYWPIHSDQEVPGLDLGWPQMHPFIGPTEVITLINPPEPDMPSIKEQARRLIKNAQQVVAVVMDVFTDVDMFADILNAAQRSVAVYVLLDEQNAQRFVNMAANCRVDLHSVPFLCVRTVGGITYQCRTGKSLKGQMMDRFLLTDCRAVLSGNYSFMWSFEKLHRCMAHLFLGQLVTTFDEEFRILFAQSQPLVLEPTLAPVEDLGLLHKRQYPNERVPLYREPRKFLSVDQTDERGRHSYNERQEGDWRMMALKRQESLHGPADIYSRLSAQQSRADPCFDQGPSRIAMLENPSLKRHSYAEGAPGRYSFLQQGMPDSEPHLKHFYRGQQPYPGPGPDVEYSGYEKFRNPDYHPTDQYPEPGLLQDAQPPETFDPVLNYLSSTRNLDFEQSSHMADLPFSSSHQRRLSLDQPHVFQTSPTPSNSADQKPFSLDPAADRKDPTVKRGLRNWRISSYLSAYENPREEGLPVAPDVFEEPPNPMQKIAPGTDVSSPKIPNVREFKVSTINRVSQMPSYAKTASREQPKKLLDEPSAAADPKRTPTPSELSSSTEGEKTEEAEQKEPKSTVLRREDSFKRNYNAALLRSSRLRSSLIFSSLDQQQSPQEAASADQQEEPGEKNEAAHTKTPFVSHVLGQRRPATREPIEWSKYIKPATFDSSSAEASKADDGEAAKKEDANDAKDPGAQDLLKPAHVRQDSPPPATPQPKLSEAEIARTEQPFQPPKPFMPSQPFIDMNDPDNRLMFFKELAAKRKAEKRKEEEARAKLPAEVEKAASCQKTEPPPKETSESEGSSENTGPAGGASKATEASSDVGQHTRKREDLVDKASHTPQSCIEHGDVDSRLDTGLQTCPSNPAEECRPFGVESGNPPPVDASAVSEAIDDRDGTKLDSASQESVLVISSSVEVPSSLASEVETQNPDSEPDAESSTPIQLRESSCDQTPLNSGSQISPSSPRGTLPSDSVKEESVSDYYPSMNSPNGFKTGVQASVSPLRQASSQSFEEPSGGLTPLDSFPQSASDTTHLGSDITVAEENYKENSATTPSVEAVGPFEDIGTDSASLHLGPESDALLGASVFELSSASATAKSPTQPPVTEMGSLFSTDFTSNAAPLETPASPQDSPRDSALPHHLDLTGPDGLRTEASDQSLSPQAQKALEEISAFDGQSDKNPSSETGPESEEPPSRPAEPSSEASAELDLLCRTAESPAPAPCTSLDGSRAEDEALDTDQSKPDKREGKVDEPAKQSTAEPADASKLPKSGQGRYHSSTANVISSSNLRDDTKLLLEQISANCQSRSESTKESPVTDDEKEDEADKHAQKEKERGFRALSRGQPKSSQEREKLLERIQSMRKERKVYSRFEMAP